MCSGHKTPNETELISTNHVPTVQVASTGGVLTPGVAKGTIDRLILSEFQASEVWGEPQSVATVALKALRHTWRHMREIAGLSDVRTEA